MVSKSSELVFTSSEAPAKRLKLSKIIKEDKSTCIDLCIYKDYFYGWPIYSYGIEYSGADVYKKPHGEEAKEPLHYFTPSIAIAEIRKYTGEEIPSWNSKYIVTSLKDESLYLFEIQEQEEKVLSLTRIPMGKRIRDVAIDNEGIIWLITDDAMLVKVSNGK